MFCAAFLQCSRARWNRKNAALKAFAYVFNEIRHFHRSYGDNRGSRAAFPAVWHQACKEHLLPVSDAKSLLPKV
jgi:hypothetical protein